jgi:hypothetical protein
MQSIYFFTCYLEDISLVITYSVDDYSEYKKQYYKLRH